MVVFWWMWGCVLAHLAGNGLLEVKLSVHDAEALKLVLHVRTFPAVSAGMVNSYCGQRVCILAKFRKCTKQ